MVFVDAMVVKIRDGQVTNRPVAPQNAEIVEPRTIRAEVRAGSSR